MNLLQFCDAHGIDISPSKIRIHFASNQGSDPLLEFFDGNFKEWQEEQSKRNFSREYILSLIQLNDKTSWLFVGFYRIVDVSQSKSTLWQYQTELLPGQDELIGRIIVQYCKNFRWSYPDYETCGDELRVIEYRRDRARISNFPGYKNVRLEKQALDIIIAQHIESWHSALSSVSGIYIIVDTTTGKPYVGSAYGEGGIWSRWSEYSISGHGDNKDLKSLLKTKGTEHSSRFQFSILEVCDLSFSTEQIIERESHWKNVLCSREFGLNAN